MKKMLSLILTLVLACAVLTPTLGAADEVVELTGLIVPHAITMDINDMPYMNEMAEKAGVNITWEIVNPGPGYVERKSVMLASGELPDMIIGGEALAKSDLAQFPDLFADMSQLLDYAPNVVKMFEEKPEVQQMVTNEDGSIRGLIKYQRFWPSNMTRQMINQEWLDELGLKAPTTWDELYDVLVAFKTMDANGNGDPNDEIPMDWAPGISGFHVMSMLAGAGLPVSMYQGEGYYVDDGEVNNFFISPEYKELIQFLNKCYLEGLINANVFTQDFTTFQSLGRSGVVGFTFGWDAADRMGPDLCDAYTYLPPLKPSADYTGEQYWENDFYMMNYAYPAASISADSQNKEAAMGYIDLYYDPYYGMQALFGSVGECIKDNGDGTYAVLPPADSSIDPGTWKWMNAVADASPMYISDELALTLPSDMRLQAEMDQVYAEYLSKYTKEDLWPGPFMKISDEQNVELAQFNLDITSIVSNKMATWITIGGVDDEWDEYVQNLEKAGLTQALSIYQEIEDAFLGK